ncbi:hypothetical protein Ae168Ps1_6344c [Pseudonocardia sp. Ae168_Ps1]|uniref:hypothetical protein n=1 Tax=unclassified Pseudonocardia TaxID=2619320 RepID=UPI00094B1FA8|nr:MULTISPECIES: hypothetical protein [unclassified Pseudonocardia]OLL69913.1 hypothetical protein Ae150APs1_6223 [Pseudonocardia sp. Ae150A_Ps1]OLL70107.1 hypothetical protein Ae168Ps1_6344c [Pseudonocardia sp. Ae168_Ps1]OLL70378.1 hypothetical protein Ae263Ps1_6322c [Pseudonocardia sp. Ae263_Ps1]OLL89159.1 hypothetical protein Ae356Ps1_6187c [Pseudonocardia sp. Ae356_Ps1]
MLDIVITAGLTGHIAFVAGWIFAEKANGRTNFRARWDQQERRHARERTALLAALDEQREDEPDQDHTAAGVEVRHG